MISFHVVYEWHVDKWFYRCRKNLVLKWVRTTIFYDSRYNKRPFNGALGHSFVTLLTGKTQKRQKFGYGYLTHHMARIVG